MVEEKFAFDSNIVIDILKKKTSIIAFVKQYPIICLPISVNGELIFGVLNSPKPESELQKIDTFIERCEILNIDSKVAQKYAEVTLELKKKGKPIPENDIWIAATCIANDMPLITQDNHFKNVDNLKTLIPIE